MSPSLSHDAVLRMGIQLYPFPTTFDTGLRYGTERIVSKSLTDILHSASWAYNLAQEFVVSCPMHIGYPSLPELNLVDPKTGPIEPGSTVTFSWDPSMFFIQIDPAVQLYTAAVAENMTDPMFGPLTRVGQNMGTMQAPADLPSGVVYLCLTTFSSGLTLDELTDHGTLAGPLTIMMS